MKQINVVRNAVYKEQLATLTVLDEIVELEKKREYLNHGCNSLYSFLTKKVKYSEGAAMRRIHGARLIARYGHVRELLRKREVSLCTLSLIAKEALKCEEKGLELIESIRGRSKREAEGVLDSGERAPMKEQVRVIAVSPRNREIAAVASLPRNDGEKSPPPAEAKNITLSKAESPPPSVKTEEVYRVSFTATKEVFQIVEELQAGMSHKFSGRKATIAELFEAGVKSLQSELKKKRTPKGKKVTATSKNSRYIPAEIRRRVFKRDNSECQYRYRDGSKCCSSWGLEVDHIKAVSLGGDSKLSNLRVTCRAHNQHLAREGGLL